MCKLETILFDVEKKESIEIGYGGVQGRDHVVIGHINGLPHLLNLCSESYELIPNTMVFPKIEEMITELGVGYTAKYHHRNHTRFYADYVLQIEGLAIGGNDKIMPQIHIEHSYDSSRKFSVSFDIHRQVCTNGMTLPFGKAELEEYGLDNLLITGKHSFANMQSTLEQFAGFIKGQLESGVFEKATKKYQVMADTMVENLAERIEEVISVTGVFDKKLVSVAVNLVNYEAKLLGQKPSEWLVYNSINSLIFDNSVNSKPIEERRKLDELVMANISSRVFAEN